MKKIPSVFQRNYEGDRQIRDEVTPGCEWVLQGEGIATRKWDGTSCLIQEGKLYKRYDAKNGKTRLLDGFRVSPSLILLQGIIQAGFLLATAMKIDGIGKHLWTSAIR